MYVQLLCYNFLLGNILNTKQWLKSRVNDILVYTKLKHLYFMHITNENLTKSNNIFRNDISYSLIN